MQHSIGASNGQRTKASSASTAERATCGHAVQRLDHEHIVKIEEYFINDGKCYIVMELLEGPELMDEVYSAGEGGRYTEADVKVIMAKLLDAVAYMHLQVVRKAGLDVCMGTLSAHSTHGDAARCARIPNAAQHTEAADRPCC